MSKRVNGLSKLKHNLTQVTVRPEPVYHWRLSKQFNQIRAAKACAMSPVTYRRCESGKPIQALTAARIAKKIGIKLSDLLT